MDARKPLPGLRHQHCSDEEGDSAFAPPREDLLAPLLFGCLHNGKLAKR
jgi:hypothetical protein